MITVRIHRTRLHLEVEEDRCVFPINLMLTRQGFVPVDPEDDAKVRQAAWAQCAKEYSEGEGAVILALIGDRFVYAIISRSDYPWDNPPTCIPKGD